VPRCGAESLMKIIIRESMCPSACPCEEKLQLKRVIIEECTVFRELCPCPRKADRRVYLAGGALWFYLPTDPILSNLKGELTPKSRHENSDFRLSGSSPDLSLQRTSMGWWVRLKIYDSKGYLVSVDFRVVVG
jgi:hypothetical protein